MSYSNYAEFDAATGFSSKIGFQLTKLQIEDVETLLGMEASCNFMEVGCGKTVISTTVALMRGNTQVLILVPPVLINPWCNWLKKVSSSVLKYRGTPSERKQMNLKDHKFIVMSYAIFRTDFNRIEHELHGDLELIVDEAHAGKNASSVLFKKVQRLML